MNRIGIAVVVGGLLGILDGLTAWFTPEVRAQLPQIVVGSTIKGVLAGVLIGLFARKVGQMGWTLAFGTFIGALLAFGVASMQGAHYLAIILPGSLVGLLTGFATVRYGRAPASVSSAPR
jgi:hypothetical protein